MQFKYDPEKILAQEYQADKDMCPFWETVRREAMAELGIENNDTKQPSAPKKASTIPEPEENLG